MLTPCFSDYLASQLGAVVITPVLRGQLGVQEDVRQSLIGELGVLDVRDIIHMTRLILNTHPYLSSSRVGLLGSEYGGYLAAMIMNTVKDVQICASITQPIVDWKENGENPKLLTFICFSIKDVLESEYFVGSFNKSFEEYEQVRLTNHLRWI